MKAMKIRKVVGRGGQEAASNKPVARESIRGGYFFKAQKMIRWTDDFPVERFGALPYFLV